MNPIGTTQLARRGLMGSLLAIAAGRLQGVLHLVLDVHDGLAVGFNFVLGGGHLWWTQSSGLGVVDQLL